MRILIAEDNTALTQGLSYVLSRKGHQVVLADDGGQALQALRKQDFDLLVLDFGLPVVHGVEVLRQVRRQGWPMPVLLFSALDDAAVRMAQQGLEVDDFLAKPFGLDEFEARVARFAREDEGPADEPLQHGALSFDPSTRTACLDGRPLVLGEQERMLLGMLLTRVGSPLGAGEMAAQLGWDRADAVRLDAAVQSLRERLGAHGQHIVKLRGIGYCMRKA